MEPQSKKNQVKQGKYGSIMTPCIFPRKPQLLGFTLGDKRTTPPRPEIYPQNLSPEYFFVWVLKTAKEGMGLFKFHKRKSVFQSHKKLLCYLGVISPCTILPPLPKKTSFLQFGQVENIHGHLFEKKTSDLFQSPIPTGRVGRG